jgi:short subunit dehydrogenase-like uncharacterized protein
VTTVWVLGATGRGGRAIAQALAASGTDVVLVGRDQGKLDELAHFLASSTRTEVAFGAAELAALIVDQTPTVVVNTVGPFTDTTLPLARASLAAGSHYIDLANELDPVRELLELDPVARDRGVTAVTGAGFGVLATEALALELRGGREPAARARVAALPAVESLGPTVLASLIDAVASGGRRYRDGRLVRHRLGAESESIPLPGLPPRPAVGVPTGELEAASRGSGAGDVLAYSSEVPSGRIVRALLPGVSAVLAVEPIRARLKGLARRLRLTLPVTPGTASWAYARLEWADGTRREAWLSTGEAYHFTARVVALIAIRLRDGSAPPGAYTPGALFGADLARQAGGKIITEPAIPVSS